MPRLPRTLLPACALLAGLGWLLLRSAEAPVVPCLPGDALERCRACHHAEAPVRWQDGRLCRPYCLSCHGEQATHHPVGVPLRKTVALPLDGHGHMVCATCHNPRQARFDTQRWNAESFFDRLFRSQSQYKTYYLQQRNDRGQLCKACH